MSLPEQDNRIWLVVDELDALGHIDGLQGRTGADPKVRRSLCAGLPVDRPGERDLWARLGQG